MEKRSLGKIQGRAALVPTSFNAEDYTVDVVFATETPVIRNSWGEPYQEILTCLSAAVRLDRLNAGGPVVDSHGTFSITNQLGVVARAWIDDGSREAKATIQLSRRPEWAGVVEDIRAGIIRNVSVGYNIYQFEVDDANRNAPPIYRAIDWEPAEISFTPVPADYLSGSRSDTQENTVLIKYMKGKNLTDAEREALAADRKRTADIFTACRAAGLTWEYAQTLIDGDLTTAEALVEIENKRTAEPVSETAVRAQERTRISEIRKAVRIAGLDDAFGDNLIDTAVPLDQARAKIIDRAAEQNPVTPRLQAGISVGTDEKDKKSRGMEATILQRAGVVSAEMAGDPGQYRGMTLMDLAKETLTEAGTNWRGMSQREIATRALQMATRDGGGGLASGDFSYILQNVLNKTLRAMYDLQDRTFAPWTRKSNATDFKNILRTQLNDLKLSKVQEGGEYTFAQTADSGETYKVAKYGKIVNIDWEAIVNDDLNAFSRIPSFLAGAVAQLQSDLIYQILTGPHLMGDNNQLFDANNHGNYTTAGTDITVQSLGIGRKMMRQQKSPGGNYLNLTPKYLICGPNKEQAALQYTSQNYVATKSADINVWVGMMRPIIDARIADNSWFLIADPMLIDTVEYATLDGQDIYTESRYGFDVDALQWKIRTVFGAKAIEWRSMYKNAGA